MAKSTTDTCVITLPLKIEKWQEDRLSARMEIARQVYNRMVYAKLQKLQYTKSLPKYQDIQQKLSDLKKQQTDNNDTLKKLQAELDILINENNKSSPKSKELVKERKKLNAEQEKLEDEVLKQKNRQMIF